MRDPKLMRLPMMIALLVGVGSCSDEPTGPDNPGLQPVGEAAAYGKWSPSGPDTCSQAVHDSYSTVGPDGMLYPTWHPPVDPGSGCTFGHEHGRDPRGSDLYNQVGDIPFGLANQYLLESGFGASRHEDHVGHKVEWENDMEMRVGDGASAVLTVTCDALVKLHQGTHSPDAFTNNMHEVVYHIRCSDGTGFSATLLVPIGTPGEFVVGCARENHIQVGVANPSISPGGGGKRAVPARTCVNEHVFNGGRPRFDSALRESWEISARLKSVSNRTLVSFNPYFQVRDPSRFFDPALEKVMGRPVDLCDQITNSSRDRCEGVAPNTAWDAPQSPFKGVRRFVDINSNNVRNADGPTVWYTDPLGNNGQTEPFPGSIRQWVAQRDNSGLDLHGPVIGNRSYDAPGVRAPN
jgi:hypothetical protein